MSRLIEKLDEEERLQPSEDGYIVYWTRRGGYLTAAHLREIADELDRRNKTWHEHVMHGVGIPMPDTVCTDFQPDWRMPLSEYARIQKESMPQIKPLVWECVNKESEWHEAQTPLGECWVVDLKKKTKPFEAGCITFKKRFDSVAEAKAWCQAEYERRVRECLL